MVCIEICNLCRVTQVNNQTFQNEELVMAEKTEKEPKIQICRESTNDEKIAELASDVGVPESYIRALMAKKPTQKDLRIITYDDSKRVFSELKDTRFATIVGQILFEFVHTKDIVRCVEIMKLLKQSGSKPMLPEIDKTNEECRRLADNLEKIINQKLNETTVNYLDSWAAKQILTMAEKYSEPYERALYILITSRKIEGMISDWLLQ